MDFTTLSVETANKYKKNKSSVCRIVIIDFSGNTIINKKEWIVEPPNNEFAKENTVLGYTTLSPEITKGCPNIFDIWSEIEEALFNKTVISYNANNNFDCLIASFNYFRRKKLEELNELRKNTDNFVQSEPLRQNNLTCDFVCLSLIIRRLFNDLTTNNLNELYSQIVPDEQVSKIDSDAKAGYLFNIILNNFKINDLITLKHKCGITLGQVLKYKTFYSIDRVKSDDYFVLNEYYPCLPITNNEIFKKYNFKKLKSGNILD